MLTALTKNPIKRKGYKKLILEYAGYKINAYYYPNGNYVYFKFSHPEPYKKEWKRQTKKDTGILFDGSKLKKH